MSRREKLRTRLSTVEAELRTRLLEELAHVAVGRNTLFFATKEFNSHGLPAHLLSSASAAIFALAETALSLQLALGESSDGSVGELFRDALRQANDLGNDHRLGPIRLAQELLERIGSDPRYL